MGTVLVNYSGKTRKATINGREYIVARATLIVPGVLNGSKGALYYPPEEIAKNFDAWNGIPLTNGHPAVNGGNVSARSPSIIQSHGLGHVYNVNITKNGRLRGEAWFDVKSCERVRPEILNKLKSGEPIELSTGLFTNNVPANNGAHHNGRQYTHVARDYRPDHLAILLDQQGACSLRDGCGVLTENGQWVTTDDGNHIYIESGTVKTGPGGKTVGSAKKGPKGEDKPEPKKPSNRTSTGDNTPDPTEDELSKRVDSKGRKIYRGNEKTRDAFEKARTEYQQASKEGRVFDRDKAKQRAEAHRDTLLGKTGISDYPQMTGSAPTPEQPKPKAEVSKGKLITDGTDSTRDLMRAQGKDTSEYDRQTGFKSKHDGAEYGNESDRDSDDKHFDKKISAAKKAKANEDAIRSKLDKVKARGPKSSAKVERLKGKLESVDARIGQLKGDLKGSKERSAALESKLTPAKTISDDDWDASVAGLEKSRAGYRAARKSGNEGEAQRHLADARKFRKTLIGNANTIGRQADLLIHNCGGKGGKPGPCPSATAEPPKLKPLAADLEQAARAGKLGTDATKTTTALITTGVMGQKPNAASRNVMEKAMDLTRRTNKRAIIGSPNGIGQTAKAVVQAQKAHEKAAQDILDAAQSDPSAAYEMRKAAAKHDLAAKAFGELASRMKPTGNEFNTNSHSGDDMATKKEKMVAFLTTNCDCWKGEKDAEILSNFDEAKLKTLIAATKRAVENGAALDGIREAFGAEAEGLTANAMPAFVKGKGLAKAPPEEVEAIAEEPAESDMEEVVPPPAKKGKKKMMPAMNTETSTARSEQPPTLNEWLASAPVEVQEIVKNARAVEQGAKEKIIKTLVSNSAARTKADRESLAAFLMTKPLAELNTLSKLSVNRREPEERDPMDFLRAPAVPSKPVANYAGLGEDFSDDEDDTAVEDSPLGFPTANVDWAAESKLAPTGARK